MIKVGKIASWIAVFGIALLFIACDNATDTTLTSQQTAISRYLTGSHKPRLIPESEIGNSMDDQPEFYTQWGLDIYRYIATYYDEERDSRTEIAIGDTIEITYSGYVFTSGAPALENLFATNDQENINSLINLGLNTSYEWTSEPYSVVIGHEQILPSLEKALLGCREGDSVEIYLTYDVAYGKHHIGSVPAKSSQVWYIDIHSVTK